MKVKNVLWEVKITENIHLAQDLIEAILNENKEAAYIFIDQEKAFDGVFNGVLGRAVH